MAIAVRFVSEESINGNDLPARPDTPYIVPIQSVNIEEACALFDTGQSSGIEGCGGHYSELGYRILARHTATQVEAL